VFAVNKADHPDARQMVSALRQMLRLRGDHGHPGTWTPPVVQTVATQSGGLDALTDALDAHRAHLEAEGRWEALRAGRLQRRVRRLVEAAWREAFWTPERRAALDAAVAALDPTARTPHALATRVLAARE